MSSSIIGSLRISLGLDSAQFESGARKARAEANRTAKSIQTSFGGLKSVLGGFAAGIGVGGIANLAKQSLEYASSLGEVAQQLSVSTNHLQSFRAAGAEAGVSQEDMDKGLAKLSVTIGQAAAGQKKQVEFFRDLGVAIRDSNGNVRSTGDIYLKIADAMGRVKDPATQARLAVIGFGKAGQQQLPLLTQGSKAINDLAESYRKFGAILTPEQIKKADDAADTMQRLKTIMSGKIAGWVADAAPGIVALTGQLERLAQLPGKYPQLMRLLGMMSLGGVDLSRVSFGGGTPLERFKAARSAMSAAEAALDETMASSAMTPKGLSTAQANLRNATAAFRKANDELRFSITGRSGNAAAATEDGALPTVLDKTGSKAKAAKEEVNFLTEAMEDFKASMASIPGAGLGGNAFFNAMDEADEASRQRTGIAGVVETIDAATQARQEAEKEVAEKQRELQANNIQQLAGLYETLFTQGTKGFLGVLEQMGMQVLSQLAAQLTMSLIGGSGGGGAGGIFSSIFGAGQASGISSIFGGGGWGMSLPGFKNGGEFIVGQPSILALEIAA